MTDDLCAEQTWRGNFWLPENPDHAQQGFLTYSPHDGVTLSLVGGFNDRERIQTSPTGYMRREGSGRFSVIHGAVGSGMPVTLVDCRVTHSPSSRFMDHIHDQDITVAHALTGVLLKDPEAPVFSKLAIELENLTEWDRHDEITVHSEPSEDGRGESWRVHVDPLKPLSVTVGELTVELVRRYHEPKFNIRRDRLETTATTFSYLDIRSSQPKSMAEWFEVTKALQDLLTLAMDAPCALLSETLTPSEELLADESAHAGRTVDVFGEHILVGERDTEGVTNMKGLFTLGSEGVEFDEVITQWLRIHADFRTTCDMIFGLKYVKDGYAQTKLITAVAAAESLHEALGVEPPITDEEFQARCSKLLHSVPKEERPWLSDKLGSNRHTLRQRLLYLAAIPDSEVMAAILPNPIAWARAARDERDPVAHGGNMTRDIQLLSAIISTTTAVVLLNLLHQLGIPKKRLKMALDHNRTMKSAKYLANKQWPAIES